MDPTAQFAEIKERLTAVYEEALELVKKHPEVLDSQDCGPRWVFATVVGEEGHEELTRYRHFVVCQTNYGDVNGCIFVGVNLKHRSSEALH